MKSENRTAKGAASTRRYLYSLCVEKFPCRVYYRVPTQPSTLPPLAFKLATPPQGPPGILSTPLPNNTIHPPQYLLNQKIGTPRGTTSIRRHSGFDFGRQNRSFKRVHLELHLYLDGPFHSGKDQNHESGRWRRPNLDWRGQLPLWGKLPPREVIWVIIFFAIDFGYMNIDRVCTVITICDAT